MFIKIDKVTAMKKFTLYTVLLLFISSLHAQQLPFFSQYMHNPYSINPAATGLNDQIPLVASYRKQWLSIPESPSVQYISAHLGQMHYTLWTPISSIIPC